MLVILNKIINMYQLTYLKLCRILTHVLVLLKEYFKHSSSFDDDDFIWKGLRALKRGIK